MITILKQPPFLVLAGQPIQFTVHTNIAGTGVRIGTAIYGTADTSESYTPNSSRNITVDFSDYVRSVPVIDKSILLPTPIQHHFASKLINVIFHETVDGISQGDPTEIKLCVFEGFIPRKFQGTFGTAYTSFNNYLLNLTAGNLPARLPVLYTAGSVEFSVLPDTPTRLYWANVQKFAGITPSKAALKVDVFFGNTAAVSMSVKLLETINIAFGDVVEWPVGYKQLGIDSWAAINKPGLLVTAYRVKVIITSEVVGTSNNYITYNVDHSYHLNPRTLFFRNHLNSFESFILTGLATLENEFESTNVNPDPLTGRPDKITSKVLATETVKANTGFISQIEMERLTLLLESKEVYELRSGVLNAIVFENLKLFSKHDTDYMFSADLEWKYAYLTTPVSI